MNQYKTICLLVICMILKTTILQAQRAEFANYTLKKATKLRAGKIYFKPLKNIGDKIAIDISNIVEENLDRYTQPLVSKENAQGAVYNTWYQQQWYERSNTPDDASVIISGTFRIDSDTEVNQNLYYETASNLANPIPYYDVRPKNSVSAVVIITYTYPDNSTDADTIRYFDESEGRKGHTIKPVSKMTISCIDFLKTEIRKTFRYVNSNKEIYLLEKVKVRDKVLKTEYKQIKQLWKERKVAAAADLFRRIYELEQSKEAAYNLGMCYELLGNLKKADEYYQLLPNFHTKTRMKGNWEFFNYLKEIGVNPQVIDFYTEPYF